MISDVRNNVSTGIVFGELVCKNSVNNIPGGRGGVLGLMFAGYVLLDSQSPYPTIVYFLANYRPHLSHLLENVILAIPT